MADRVGRKAFHRQQQASQHRPDSWGNLKAIRCPTMLLTGRQDRLSAPPELQQAMAAVIEGARQIVIEDCGHLSPLERPGGSHRGAQGVAERYNRAESLSNSPLMAAVVVVLEQLVVLRGEQFHRHVMHEIDEGGVLGPAEIARRAQEREGIVALAERGIENDIAAMAGLYWVQGAPLQMAPLIGRRAVKQQPHMEDAPGIGAGRGGELCVGGPGSRRRTSD